jgi:hypothetical protein
MLQRTRDVARDWAQPEQQHGGLDLGPAGIDGLTVPKEMLAKRKHAAAAKTEAGRAPLGGRLQVPQPIASGRGAFVSTRKDTPPASTVRPGLGVIFGDRAQAEHGAGASGFTQRLDQPGPHQYSQAAPPPVDDAQSFASFGAPQPASSPASFHPDPSPYYDAPAPPHDPYASSYPPAYSTAPPTQAYHPYAEQGYDAHAAGRGWGSAPQYQPPAEYAGYADPGAGYDGHGYTHHDPHQQYGQSYDQGLAPSESYHSNQSYSYGHGQDHSHDHSHSHGHGYGNGHDHSHSHGYPPQEDYYRAPQGHYASNTAYSAPQPPAPIYAPSYAPPYTQGYEPAPRFQDTHHHQDTQSHYSGPTPDERQRMDVRRAYASMGDPGWAPTASHASSPPHATAEAASSYNPGGVVPPRTPGLFSEVEQFDPRVGVKTESADYASIFMPSSASIADDESLSISRAVHAPPDADEEPYQSARATATPAFRPHAPAKDSFTGLRPTPSTLFSSAGPSAATDRFSGESLSSVAATATAAGYYSGSKVKRSASSPVHRELSKARKTAVSGKGSRARASPARTNSAQTHMYAGRTPILTPPASDGAADKPVQTLPEAQAPLPCVLRSVANDELPAYSTSEEQDASTASIMAEADEIISGSSPFDTDQSLFADPAAVEDSPPQAREPVNTTPVDPAPPATGYDRTVPFSPLINVSSPVAMRDKADKPPEKKAQPRHVFISQGVVRSVHVGDCVVELVGEDGTPQEKLPSPRRLMSPSQANLLTYCPTSASESHLQDRRIQTADTQSSTQNSIVSRATTQSWWNKSQ